MLSLVHCTPYERCINQVHTVVLSITFVVPKHVSVCACPVVKNTGILTVARVVRAARPRAMAVPSHATTTYRLSPYVWRCGTFSSYDTIQCGFLFLFSNFEKSMGNKSNQVKLLNIVVPCKIGVQFDDTDILCNYLYLLSHISIIHTKEDAIYVYVKSLGVLSNRNRHATTTTVSYCIYVATRSTFKSTTYVVFSVKTCCAV